MPSPSCLQLLRKEELGRRLLYFEGFLHFAALVLLLNKLLKSLLRQGKTS